MMVLFGETKKKSCLYVNNERSPTRLNKNNQRVKNKVEYILPDRSLLVHLHWTHLLSENFQLCMFVQLFPMLIHLRTIYNIRPLNSISNCSIEKDMLEIENKSEIYVIHFINKKE